MTSIGKLVNAALLRLALGGNAPPEGAKGTSACNSPVPGGLAAPLMAQPLRDASLQELLNPKYSTYSRVWLLEPKIDGLRALWVGDRWLTREGNPMACCDHIIPAAKMIEEMCGFPVFLDSEFVHGDGYDAALSAFRSGTPSGMVAVFDFLPLNIWETGLAYNEWPIERRKDVLAAIFAELGTPFMSFIPGRYVDAQNIPQAVASLFQIGLEGVCFKRPASTYHRATNSDAFRIKQVVTHDVTVFDVATSRGKPPVLLCRGPTGPAKITHGFTRAELHEIEAIIVRGGSCIVEASGYHRVGAKGQPLKFKRIRYDKGTSS